MLNKKILLCRTEEAKKRIQLERELEAERKRQEEEARRLEQELARQREARRRQSCREAKRLVRVLFIEAVRVASHGGRTTQLDVKPDVSEFLHDELTAEGFTFEKSGMPKLEQELELRVGQLLSLFDDQPQLISFRERLVALLESSEEVECRELGNLIRNILLELKDEDEYDEVLNESAREYLQECLLPFLDISHESIYLDRFSLHWQRAELSRQCFTGRAHLPSWLLSNSGYGLMKGVSESAEKEADSGESGACFELVSLPGDERRWGKNAMTKFVHRDQPIGVTPFTPEVMMELFEALGFKVQLAESGGATYLRISW